MRDLVSAQNDANAYSASLKKAYSQNGYLEKFDLPIIAIEEVELDIRYGVKGVDENKEQYEIDHIVLPQVIRELSAEITDYIISYNESRDTKSNDGDNNRFEIASSFKNRLQDMLLSNIGSILNEIGDFKEDELIIIFEKVLKNELISHPYNANRIDYVNKIVSEYSQYLKGLIPKIIKDMNCKRRRLTASMDVIIGSEELRKIPEEYVHSFKVKLKPDSINMIVADPDSEY